MKKTATKKKSTPVTSTISQIKAKNRIDLPMLIILLMIIALGLVMVLSASSPTGASEGDTYKHFKTQTIAAIIGMVLMFVLSNINYDIFKRIYKLVYIGSILILFAVLIPKIGVESNGARRWINLGMQIQPSEITKIGLIIYVAGYYSDPKTKLTNIWNACLKPFFAVLIPIGILLVVQNHLSAGIVIGMVTAAMVVMSGCQLKYLIYIMGVVLGGAALIFPFAKDKLMSSFRSDRIMAWLDPWADTSATSYQTVQSLYAIGSGGLFGVGLGESKQKYLYIPEAHNDFIFAIIAEELGFVGCAVVLGLFAMLVIRGISIAIRAKDTFGSLIAIGITALIAIQVILNIAVVTNSIPNTGISLPFISYGGSSMVILLAAMGILFNISRSAKKI